MDDRSGKGYVGGIIGGQDSTDLIRCVNYGICSGHSSGYTGAIAGVEVNDGKYRIENCYALDGSASKLYGYSRSTYCTEKNNSFVSAADKTKLTSYPAIDFDAAYVMRDEGVVLRVHAPALAGDVDEDGWLTNTDITLLVRYLSGWEVSVRIDLCDFNSDGRITNRDAIAAIVTLSKNEF